jgi:hypothetical protein
VARKGRWRVGDRQATDGQTGPSAATGEEATVQRSPDHADDRQGQDQQPGIERVVVADLLEVDAVEVQERPEGGEGDDGVVPSTGSSSTLRKNRSSRTRIPTSDIAASFSI